MKIKVDYTEDADLYGISIWIDFNCYSVFTENESENLFIFNAPIEQTFTCFEDAKHFAVLNHLLKRSKLL